MSLSAQYEAGNHIAVWQRIREFDRIPAKHRTDVEAVAEATMRRVKHNADLLARRLRKSGWRVLLAPETDLRTRPRRADARAIERIVSLSGKPVPVSLMAFWRVVGGINLVWDYHCGSCAPHLGTELPLADVDPLCIDPPFVLEYLFEERDQQLGDRDQARRGDRLSITLSPDRLHKANISGVDPYVIIVPYEGADPIVANEEHGLPFVDYLRMAFSWAGFPGLERYAGRLTVERFLAEFKRGFVPF